MGEWTIRAYAGREMHEVRAAWGPENPEIETLEELAASVYLGLHRMRPEMAREAKVDVFGGVPYRRVFHGRFRVNNGKVLRIERPALEIVPEPAPHSAQVLQFRRPAR